MKELYLATPLFIRDFFHFVSSYHIFGVIPLDIIAHLSVSTTITLLLRKMKMSYLVVFSTITLIGLTKEYYDWFAMTSSVPEFFKDMAMNFLYPTLSYAIYKLKKK